MIDKNTIEKFYGDVDRLKLKFPVADIAKATKESKGNVSKYLSRKLEPSESFLQRFYNSFDIPVLEEETNPTLLTLAESNKLHAESNIILARSHEKLVLTHERIVNLLEARLTADGFVKNEGEETAVLKTIRDLVLKVGVDAGSWKSKEEGMKVVHKIAGENAAYTKAASRKHG